MHKIVLGLAGRKGSGKSTVCDCLVDQFGAVKSSFADPLKQMLKTLGLNDAQLWGDQKEVPDHDILMGKTPRHAMQTLGTEWGRTHIDPKVWAEAWKRLPLLERPTFVLVEDVRFDNEVDAIHDVGGFVFGLERGRPKFWHSMKERMRWVHQSENFRQLVKRKGLVVVSNDGTPEATADLIMMELNRLLDERREEALSVRM